MPDRSRLAAPSGRRRPIGVAIGLLEGSRFVSCRLPGRGVHVAESTRIAVGRLEWPPRVAHAPQPPVRAHKANHPPPRLRWPQPVPVSVAAIEHQAIDALRPTRGERDGSTPPARDTDQRHPLQRQLVDHGAERSNLELWGERLRPSLPFRQPGPNTVVTHHGSSGRQAFHKTAKRFETPVVDHTGHPPRRHHERGAAPHHRKRDPSPVRRPRKAGGLSHRPTVAVGQRGRPPKCSRNDFG